jgi:pilus assembly protein CpaF
MAEATPWEEESEGASGINWGSSDPNQWRRTAKPSVPPAAATPAPAPAVSENIESLGDLFGDDPTPTPSAPDAPTPPPAPTWPVRRWQAQAELFSAVQSLLSFVANDSMVSTQLSDIQLTNDRIRDAAQRELFQRVLSEKAVAQASFTSLARGRAPELFEIAYDEFIGLGPLAPLWWDDDVTEIMVDSFEMIYVEHNGRILETPARFQSPEHVSQLARQLAEKFSGRSISNTNPLVTSELPGARVTFAFGDVVRSGISITLRKFRPLLGMESLLTRGALSTEMRDFLADAVRARATVLVSGGTGTGKTTMINALSEFIPDTERVVTIEDAYELKLSSRYVVAMQSKERTTADSKIVISQADLMVNALRMRPDRIIVGEIREPKGAQVMLQAANTGHDGTMSTIHANTTGAAVNFRLAGLVQTASGMSSEVALREVATAIDLVVQVTRRAGLRFISEIAVLDPSCIRNGEIIPYPIFSGALVNGAPTFQRVGRVGADTVLAVKLAEAGLDPARWGGVS